MAYVGLGFQAPDFGRTLGQVEQIKSNRLSQLLTQGQIDERAALANALPTIGPMLADPNQRAQGISQLLGLGPAGFQIAAPLMAEDRLANRDRERMEFEREKFAEQMGLQRAQMAQAASAANADPAAVREWQYFSRLSPEQQSQYLLMKRAQPFLNTGTEFVRPDPITGSPAAAVPQNLRGREVEIAVGKREGQDIADAPQAIRTADETMRLIDAIRTHPALRASTGLLSATQAIPGTPMFDFGQRVRQLEGRAFLEAFESLKGGGQITEIEGIKATQAQARLNSAQSASDYVAALTEMRDMLEQARRENIERLRNAGREPPAPRQTGAQPQTPRLEIESRPDAPRPAPAVGAVEDGWRFMGGDPSSPSSWQRAR